VSLWNQWKRAGRRILGRGEQAGYGEPYLAGGGEAEQVDLSAAASETDPFYDPPPAGGGRPADEVPGDDAFSSGEPDRPPEPPTGGLSISGWVEERAHRVVQRAYESKAGDLEERALRVIGSVYERTADDLEERAVRAMRAAIESEAERIKEAIEHSIGIKKREVRLSLLVLVVSSLAYLALYWFTARPEPPGAADPAPRTTPEAHEPR
jgi:hypothetical protein